MNHRVSTIVLILLLLLIPILSVLGTLVSEEVDDICNQDNHTLFRFNGTWGCANLMDINYFNFTVNNITNLYNNYSLWSNQTINDADTNESWNVFNQILNTTSNTQFNNMIINGTLTYSGGQYPRFYANADDYGFWLESKGPGKRGSPYMAFRGHDGVSLNEMLIHARFQRQNEYYLEVTDNSGNPSITMDDDGQVNVSWGQFVVGPEPRQWITLIDGSGNSGSPIRIISSTAGNTISTSGGNVFNAGTANNFRSLSGNTGFQIGDGNVWAYVNMATYNTTDYSSHSTLRHYPWVNTWQINLHQNINAGMDGGWFILNDTDVNISSHSNFVIDGNVSGRACTARYAGSIYYDDVLDNHYGCNSTDWEQLTNDVVYGEMWNKTSGGWTFAIPNFGEYYNLTNLSAGYLNGFTFDKSNLTAQYDGLYKFDWSMSFSGGGNNLYGTVLATNGMRNLSCYATRKLGASGDVGNAGSSCLLYLRAGDRVNLQIEDETNPASDIGVYNVNINAVRINDG